MSQLVKKSKNLKNHDHKISIIRTNFSPRVVSIFLVKGSLPDVFLNFLSFEPTRNVGARFVVEKPEFDFGSIK